MKKFGTGHLLLGFIVTLVGLVLNAGVAYQSINTIAENNRVTAATSNVLASLDQMLDCLKNVQQSQREYIKTSNPQQLVIIRGDLTALSEQLKLFANLEIDRQLVSTFIAKIDRQVAKSEIDSERLSTQAQQLIDRVRQDIANLKNAKWQEMSNLQFESQRNLTDTKLAFGIAGLLDLLLLVGLYCSIGYDLVKRQEAELKLKNYADEFEELYHSAPCGYHSLDANGNFLQINRTELQMLGYTEDEIVNRHTFTELLTPTSASLFRKKLSEIERQGGMRDLELQMVHKDGRIVPVSMTTIVVTDEAGEYLASRSTTIEISERIRLRQQAKLLAEISEKIRASLQLTEILQTAVTEVQKLLAVDRVLIFRLENNGGTVLQERVLPGFPVVMGNNITDPCLDSTYQLKYQQGEIDGVDDITQAGFQPCYVEFLQQFAVKASAIVPIYLRDELWGLLIVHQCQSPRHWQPNELETLVRLATQIGIALAQAQSLEQERLQRQELARSNAELERFAHVASHDLQEPLRMVTSYLQLLERRYQHQLDDDANDFIAYAVDGAVRMQALIQALLSYARLSSRGQPFELVDTNAVVQNAIDNLHVTITESGAIVHSEPLPVVWGDATQLTQLFQNLLANAIKFRRELPPTIEITVQRIDTTVSTLPDDCIQATAASVAPSGSVWCFTVADNGIGIESQYLKRIFAIFQRLHSRSDYPGTGVGLAICDKIVERHGGKIWVESIPERGSRFSFIIPEVSSSTIPSHADRQPQD